MERWVIVTDEGKLFLHTENDGAAFLSKGAEATEVPITLTELKNYIKSHWTLYDEAVAELKEKGFVVMGDRVFKEIIQG